MQVKNFYRLIIMSIVVFLISFELLIGQDLPMGQRISERITGPFHFRLIMQPLVAVIVGIKDGSKDAKGGNPPYIFEIFTNSKGRLTILRNGFNSIFTPLLVGIVLDAIFQLIIFNKLRIIGAFLVGIILIGLPYSFSRGITNRIKSSTSK